MRHAAPSTARAASASASRSSIVPLLPISPAVRSQRPTRSPPATCLAIVPPRPISRSSGWGPNTSRSTGSMNLPRHRRERAQHLTDELVERALTDPPYDDDEIVLPVDV